MLTADFRKANRARKELIGAIRANLARMQAKLQDLGYAACNALRCHFHPCGLQFCFVRADVSSAVILAPLLLPSSSPIRSPTASWTLLLRSQVLLSNLTCRENTVVWKYNVLRVMVWI